MSTRTRRVSLMTTMSNESCERVQVPHDKQSISNGLNNTLRKSKKELSVWRTLLATLSLVLLLHHGSNILLDYMASTEGLCPQASELLPQKHAEIFKSLTQLYGTDAYKTKAISWLSGAVRIPTESFDTLGPVGEDPHWEIFVSFHDYLSTSFPLVHVALEVTKVNTYGLVFHWNGSDASLKPLLLAAHQDVVPVHPDTFDQWIHPPYSGYWDGQRIWGRGSLDNKSCLIGILGTIEALLERGFIPTRSIVLAFGFDEESKGTEGAGHLSVYLEEQFGKNGFAMLVDEGSRFQQQYGTTFSFPGVAEKGFTNIKLQVTTPGGHSSIPPPHTGIGILSALLVELEAHPVIPHLVRDTPIYSTVECFGAHAQSLPSRIKKAIARSVNSDTQLKRVERYFFKHDKTTSTIASTTQAIDVVQGGVKANALPELAYAIINHRIASDSSLRAIEERYIELLQHQAQHYNLSFLPFGKTTEPESEDPFYGALKVDHSMPNGGLVPSRVTPVGDAKPFQLLSGTIKATFNTYRGLTTAEGETEKGIKVAPSALTGNTDTRFYWNLTEHIFRYSHHNTGDGSQALGAAHAANEFIEWDHWAETIQFFTTLILNADENEL